LFTNSHTYVVLRIMLCRGLVPKRDEGPSLAYTT
jgi:hypothetical protein